VVHQSKIISDMRVDINKMKDYYEVLDFVSETAPQLGNAKPAQGVDIEAMGGAFGASGMGYGGDYSSNVKG